MPFKCLGLFLVLLTTSYFSIAASFEKTKTKPTTSPKTDGVYVNSGTDTFGELSVLFIQSYRGYSRALSPFVILAQMYLSRGDNSLSHFETAKMSLEESV